MTRWSPWAGIVLVLVLTSTLVAGIWTWRRRARPAPELTRKAVHVGMGAIATTLPWLFDAPWPVLLLCGGLGVALAALKLLARRSELGAAIHDVGRESRGDLYFALSVALLWVLASDDWLLFLVPVLVLTLGDAIAALVGMHYGRRYFDGRRGGKTLEGSTALFVVAVASVLVPLVASHRVAPVPALLIAATMALLVTLLEAMAWHGLDNVFVPLGAFLLLRDSLALGVADLGWRLAVAVGCVVAVVLARTRTTLSDAALASAALVGYVVWAARGWWWLVPPAALFAVYTWLFPRRGAGAGRAHDVEAVAGVAMPAIGWLLAGRVMTVDTFVPYVATFVAQLAMIAVVHASGRRNDGAGRPVLPLVLGGALLMLPMVLLVRPWTLVPLAGATSFAGAAVAGLAINRGLDRVTPGLQLEPQWTRQARWALLASLFTAPLLRW